MLAFSANISTLFLERPVLERPAAAKAAGFDAVEIQFPYDHPADEWAETLQSVDVALAVINMPVGDMLTGGAGLASMPGRQALFREAALRAAAYARVMRPRSVNILAGWPPAAVGRDPCLSVLAENLRFAAEVMADAGAGVVLEAVDTIDRPGYFIARTDEALEAIDLANHANLGIQYDVYHMQVMEGDLIRTLQRVHHRIGHLQFADNPGRHEPGTGEINFDNVFAAIERLPYAGFVGAEYAPSGATADSLGWLARIRDARCV